MLATCINDFADARHAGTITAGIELIQLRNLPFIAE